MTCWLINTTRQNYEIMKARNFDLLGVDGANSRKASQMNPNDGLVIYVREDRSFVATATVKSRCFQGQSLIWKSQDKDERFRHRVRIAADIVAEDECGIVDGLQIGPSLDYIKRWPPEMWELALFGMVHIISKRDFDFIEGELNRLQESSDAD